MGLESRTTIDYSLGKSRELSGSEQTHLRQIRGESNAFGGGSDLSASLPCPASISHLQKTKASKKEDTLQTSGCKGSFFSGFGGNVVGSPLWDGGWGCLLAKSGLFCEV